MADFEIKRGDTRKPLRVQLLDKDGVPVSLVGASVLFRMRGAAEGAPPKVSATATIDDAAAGLVSYVWTAPNVDTAGQFKGEFAVTIAAKTETVPAGGYLSITIWENLA